jgi:hypothetical protein
VQPFALSTETEGKPSFFEVVFLIDGIKYRYGFEAARQRILSEWLFFVPSRREARLFTRDASGILCGRAFKEGRGLEDKTRPNALFLSVVAQFNGAISTTIILWFKMLSIISGLNDRSYRFDTVKQFERDDLREEIIRLVKSLDLGIVDIQIEKAGEYQDKEKPDIEITIDTPQVVTDREYAFLDDFIRILSLPPRPIRTVHTLYDKSGLPVSLESFNFGEQESDGTQKLFYLAGPLINVLSNGKVLFIDEMEVRMHPLITRAIIGLFNSLETNPKRAQLVFTTHDTNLLSNKIFRRDQVWFMEKDRFGASHLYSLAELKVRNDASFESDYIQGRYGAIPYLGDLKRVICDVEA